VYEVKQVLTEVGVVAVLYSSMIAKNSMKKNSDGKETMLN
jgi:hypothetical protein